MLPGVIDSLDVQRVAGLAADAEAERDPLRRRDGGEEGGRHEEEVDVDEYKKNLAAALGVAEEKVAVIEKIKHKVKATYVLKQTLDEFESSGMRAKIITKIATAAGVSEDAVELEVQQADLETRRRRRLSEGVTVKATITTDDKEAAITKAAMPTTTEEAAVLLEVEVAEVTEAPAEGGGRARGDDHRRHSGGRGRDRRLAQRHRRLRGGRIDGARHRGRRDGECRLRRRRRHVAAAAVAAAVAGAAAGGVAAAGDPERDRGRGARGARAPRRCDHRDRRRRLLRGRRLPDPHRDLLLLHEVGPRRRRQGRHLEGLSKNDELRERDKRQRFDPVRQAVAAPPIFHLRY